MLRLPIQLRSSKNILHSPHHSRPFLSRERRGQTIQPRKCSMFRLTLLSLSVLILACSREAPPTGPADPAGKANQYQQPPSAPTNLRAVVLSDTSASVSWQAVRDATDYDLAYKPVGGGWAIWPHIGAEESHNTITSLQPETEYHWAVRAENNHGASSWIRGDNFTTLVTGDVVPLTPIDADTTALALIDSTATAFNIELVFLSPIPEEKRQWIADVARRWEYFFFDVPDHKFLYDTPITLYGGRSITIRAGESIDDIRIYVRTGFDLDHPGIEGGHSNGGCQVLLFRDNAYTPLVAEIILNDQLLDEDVFKTARFPAHQKKKLRENWNWRGTFHHELGHAFGIGTSPAWNHSVTLDRSSDYGAFFAGTNALREYHQIHPHPHEKGIPLGFDSFDEIIPGHWHIDRRVEYGTLGWTFFDRYYSRGENLTNITRISLGAFEDMGWPVNYDAAMSKLLDDQRLGDCWVGSQYRPETRSFKISDREKWVNFEMDCE